MIFCILLLILAVMLVVFYVCYRIVFYVPRKKTLDPRNLMTGEQYDCLRDVSLRLIDDAEAIPYEDVSVMSGDGLKLYGRYYETAKGAPVQILMHGYQGMALRDFSGGLQLALSSGSNVILVDERAHGRSEGKYLSFGIHEREDCLAWVDYALKRFGPETKIILVGISMGASTVLMTADMALPANVKGIIADCGYTSPGAIIRQVIRDRHYPEALTYFCVSMGARIFGRLDLDGISATEALKRANVPVLFIHGEDDRFVPCAMSREMYAACASQKTLLTVPGAGHGISFLIDEERYKATFLAFLEKILA